MLSDSEKGGGGLVPILLGGDGCTFCVYQVRNPDLRQ